MELNEAGASVSDKKDSVNSTQQMPPPTNKKKASPFVGIGIIVVILIVAYFVFQAKQTSVSNSINSSLTSATNKTGPFLTQVQIRNVVPQYNSSSAYVSFEEQYIPQENLSNYTTWLIPLRPNVTGDYFILSYGSGGLSMSENIFLLNNTYSKQQFSSVCSAFTNSFAQNFNESSSGSYVNGQFVNNGYHYYIKSIIDSSGSINGMNYTYSVLVPTSNSSTTNATVLCGFKNNKFVLFDMNTVNESSFSSINPKVNKASLLSYISGDLS